MQKSTENWVITLLQSIDRQDVDAFASYLAEDVVFKFGNADPISGKQAVAQVVQGFFNSIKDLRHELVDIWIDENDVICRGVVTYTRIDSSTLSVPFANFFRLGGELIADYQIYVDISELYQVA